MYFFFFFLVSHIACLYFRLGIPVQFVLKIVKFLQFVNITKNTSLSPGGLSNVGNELIEVKPPVTLSKRLESSLTTFYNESSAQH